MPAIPREKAGMSEVSYPEVGDLGVVFLSVLVHADGSVDVDSAMPCKVVGKTDERIWVRLFAGSVVRQVDMAYWDYMQKIARALDFI